MIQARPPVDVMPTPVRPVLRILVRSTGELDDSIL